MRKNAHSLPIQNHDPFNRAFPALTLELHDYIQRAPDIFSHIAPGHLRSGLQDQQRQLLDRAFGGIGVDRTDRAWMASVDTPQECQRLFAPHFATDYICASECLPDVVDVRDEFLIYKTDIRTSVAVTRKYAQVR